jgi:hypothetical protein
MTMQHDYGRRQAGERALIERDERGSDWSKEERARDREMQVVPNFESLRVLYQKILKK